MSEKSHVSIEQHVCLVCGMPFDTGSILIDRRLKNSLEARTATGWGLCPEHQRLADLGFVALVECDPERSGAGSQTERLHPEQAHRTGKLAHLRRESFAQVFNVSTDVAHVVVFVEPGVIERLQGMASPAP